jgi:Holliday junction resolvase RusA-like endonuclease
VIRFVIPGPPVAKGRHRCRCIGNKPRAYTPQDTREWEQAAAMYAKAAGVQRLAGVPVVVEINAVVPRRKSTPKSRPEREVCDTRPDGDNYEKAILDGVFGLEGMEDGRVVRMTWTKWRAALGEEPHVEVTMRAWDAQGVGDV